MSVEKSKLKELAEGMKGWDKMTECWPSDENGPDWQVGRLDEDDERWPLLTVDTEQYDQEQDAPKVAQYYAAANPVAVLALFAEIEALSKDLESHKRMLLSAAVSIGTIGEALGAEMDDDPSELEGLAAELRKDADRFRFINDCPIRTMVALSRKAADADFDLESECDRIMSKIASKKTGD